MSELRENNTFPVANLAMREILVLGPVSPNGSKMHKISHWFFFPATLDTAVELSIMLLRRRNISAPRNPAS
jgi:hypothetical protein